MNEESGQRELEIDFGQRVDWRPRRADGLERLRAFLPRAGRAYSKSRNFDLGPTDRSNVSALSPLIRFRLVLEEEVLRETLRVHSLEAAEKFVEEVVWRGYFKGWLEHRPQVWFGYLRERDALIRRLADDAALRADYENAIDGKTGIECFDAWARELVETGYLHNHARMWFASIWIYTLELPWPLGADFFLRHLLDGDPASNTSSWRWVCGLHTPGKTYRASAANIARFTRGRFRPDGDLAQIAPPLSESSIGDARPLAQALTLRADERFALLVTEEDCHPESLELPSPPAAIFGWSATDYRSPLDVGEPAREFADGAVADALERCGEHFAIEPVHFPSETAAQMIAETMKAADLRNLVTAHVPVGPTSDSIRIPRGEWAEAGIRSIDLRRPYDSLLWPNATRGFFALKKKIPELLAANGIV